MSSDFSLTAPDTKRIGKRLQEFRGSIQRRINGGALYFAATPMLAAAKAKAPVRTGALRESLIKVRRNYHRKGLVVVLVGPQWGFVRYYRNEGRTAQIPGIYAPIVERGSATQAPRPFMRPAFQSTKYVAESRYLQKLRMGVTKEKQKMAQTATRV